MTFCRQNAVRILKASSYFNKDNLIWTIVNQVLKNLKDKRGTPKSHRESECRKELPFLGLRNKRRHWDY